MAAHGRGRANWLVRVLTPTNPLPAAEDVVEPEFPASETIEALAKTTRAVLLPERFCAIGYAAGRREVFRAWGRTVPDELVLTPDWQATDSPEKLLAGERAWMVDFDAALANGMAIEVSTQHHGSAGVAFDLANGTLERLLVVGFEWTKGAADAGADSPSLLAAHRDSTGLGFAPLGTPTNNTESRAPAGRRRTPPVPPAPSTDALGLLHWAFGFAPEACPPNNIDNAHLAEQRTSLHMMNLLWRGTFAQYLMRDVEPARRELRAAAARRPRCTRCGVMPPPTCGRPARCRCCACASNRTGCCRWWASASRRGLARRAALGKVLGVLRPMWELAAPRCHGSSTATSTARSRSCRRLPGRRPRTIATRTRQGMCKNPTPITARKRRARGPVVQSVLSALGPWQRLASAHRRLQRLPARPALFRRLPRRGAVGTGR